jgi:ATP-binding cassette subfamily B protein
MMAPDLGTGWWTYIKYDQEHDRPKMSWALLRRVWGYAKPYQLKVMGLLTTIFAITGLSLIPPLLYRDLIDNAIINGDTTRLNWLALGMIGIPLLSAAIGFGQRFLSATIGEGLIADLRNALFNHMQQMSLRFFTHTKTGALMSRLNNDVVGAQRALTGTFINIVTNLVTVVATVTIMLSLEWRLTLLSIAIVPIFLAPTRRVGRKLREIRRRSLNLNARMNNLMQETLNIDGALLVKLFGRQGDERERFRQRSTAVANIGVRSAMVGRWFFMGLGLISAIGTAVVFWVGGHMILEGVFTVGTIVAFGAYLTQLYGPLSQSAMRMSSSPPVWSALSAYLRCWTYRWKSVKGLMRSCLPEVTGSITFDNVTFSYTEGGDGGSALLGLGIDRHSKDYDATVTKTVQKASRTKALESVSFEIKPGELAALVGPSGAGKTTVTYLLPRLYDPTGGNICLDGHDLRDMTLDSLSNAIGMVTQETYLFNDYAERQSSLCRTWRLSVRS